MVMSSDQASASWQLSFRDPAGQPVTADARADGAESLVGEFLAARTVWLNGSQYRQLRLAAVPDRSAGYERLDNEILAGRRLNAVAGDFDYPPVVSRLHGDEAESAEPFALLESYAGEPLHAVVGNLMDDEQRDFELSLLTGLCWLDAARIAHRNLTPSTVRWDGAGRRAQITDFSLCTVFGVPREAAGSADWVGPEQRPGGKVAGLVSDRDDMHPAARLIYYARSEGAKLTRRDQLAEVGLGYLDQQFGPPESRLTARQLLATRLGTDSTVPAGPGSDARLRQGHEVFDAMRREKHPALDRQPPPPAVQPVPGPGPGNGTPPPVTANSGRRHRWRLGGHS
jgi:hypothetical protein